MIFHHSNMCTSVYSTCKTNIILDAMNYCSMLYRLRTYHELLHDEHSTNLSFSPCLYPALSQAAPGWRMCICIDPNGLYPALTQAATGWRMSFRIDPNGIRIAMLHTLVRSIICVSILSNHHERDHSCPADVHLHIRLQSTDSTAQ